MNISALKYPGFRRYLVGNLFGLHANWMHRLTLGWLAWDISASPSYVGLVSFLVFAPTLFGAPVFGVFADRVDLKKAALMIQSLVALHALSLYFLIHFGVISQTVLALYAASIGTTFSAYHPVRLSLAPRLVERMDVPSLVGFTALNFNLSRLSGPAIGGAIIAGLGVGAAIITIFVLTLPFLLLLSTLSPRPTEKTRHREPFLQSFQQGLSYAVQSQMILGSMAMTAILSVLVRGVTEVLPVIADGIYARGPAGLGTLTASAGVGALIASAIQLLAHPVKRGRIPRRAVAGAFLAPLALLILSLIHTWPAAIAAVAGIGFVSTIVGVNFQSAIQLELDDGMRGRVMSLWSTVAVGGTSLGALSIGVTLEHVGTSLGFGAYAVTYAVMLTVLLRWLLQNSR